MLEILIVDDDRAVRRSLELHLAGRGFTVRGAGSLAEGEAAWRESMPDLVILDLMLPDGTGTELLQRMRDAGRRTPAIMVTGHHEMEHAVAGMRAGAFDFIHKPLDVDELDAVLDRAAAHLREGARPGLETAPGEALGRPGAIVGRSRAVLELHKAIGRASRGRANVLIRGESGTGKELVARAIHGNLAAGEPFVAVNCSALVPALLESELFGHEKGAFTGAVQRRRGRLELAGRGVLFLDEIGDLPLDLQAKLLRVLQERTFERVGGAEALPFAAVLIAATHRDLEAMLGEGAFREDLYYRLKVVEIAVPPLRTRREDVPVLVAHFLARYNAEFHRRVTRVPASVLARLRSYSWPGNVRELENRIQAGIMASPGDTLVVEVPEGGPVPPAARTWRRTLKDVEAEHVRAVLEQVGWNQGEACTILGISRPTLRKKIQDHGLKESPADG
ncbi:MAG: sigma-54-dependent Fis family transcriptional regulator [Candidatus Krumholzibacteriota bacterium]|nr:sigma-54-dependent Fis family transcriptional regulator [Candidatus Krumholzibacteriota bacterium]